MSCLELLRLSSGFSTILKFSVVLSVFSWLIITLFVFNHEVSFGPLSHASLRECRMLHQHRLLQHCHAHSNWQCGGNITVNILFLSFENPTCRLRALRRSTQGVWHFSARLLGCTCGGGGSLRQGPPGGTPRGEVRPPTGRSAPRLCIAKPLTSLRSIWNLPSACKTQSFHTFRPPGKPRPICYAPTKVSARPPTRWILWIARYQAVAG